MRRNNNIAACAICTLAACSQGTSTTAASASPAAARTTAARPAAAVSGNGDWADPCRVIAAADVVGILNKPVVAKPVGADGTPGACKYQTQSSAYVSINVAQGDGAKFWWTLATTSQGANTPLVGVGDKALYNAFAGGRPLIASKGDTTCFVDVMGINSEAEVDITKDRGETLARKLGALCTKIFAAH